MEPKDLVEIGLTSNQAKVYLKLIKQPAQTGGQIAKAVSLDRSSVYNILASLAKKGLISHVFEEKVKVFSPTDPECLLKDHEERKEKITSMIKDLRRIKKDAEAELTVSVYHGRAGLNTFMDSLLQYRTFKSVGGAGLSLIFDILKSERPTPKTRFPKNLASCRIITSPRHEKNVKANYDRTNITVKTMEDIPEPICYTLVNDTLAIYSLDGKPRLVLIKDSAIAASLNAGFDKIWESLR